METQVKHPATTSPREFHLFPNLPFELRRIIWPMILPWPRACVGSERGSTAWRPIYIIDRISQDSRSVYLSEYTRLFDTDPGWSMWNWVPRALWSMLRLRCEAPFPSKTGPREWPLYVDLSQTVIFIGWLDLQRAHKGKSIVEWMTLKTKDKARSIIFNFNCGPKGYGGKLLRVEDIKAIYDALEQQLQEFPNLQTLRLLLDDYLWCPRTAFPYPNPNREDPKWRPYLDYFETMKDLEGRPMVKVEIGNRWDYMNNWLRFPQIQ
jgi:hypothetical protein